MKNQSIIQILKKVEPGYLSWDDNEIEAQIKAIYECGYRWFEKGGRVGFIHSESGVYLKLAGLHYYSPERLRQTYEEVWSKDFGNIRKREKKVKVIKSFFLMVFSLLTLIVLEKEIALGIFAILGLRTVYFYIIYQREKRTASKQPAI